MTDEKLKNSQQIIDKCLETYGNKPLDPEDALSLVKAIIGLKSLPAIDGANPVASGFAALYVLSIIEASVAEKAQAYLQTTAHPDALEQFIYIFIDEAPSDILDKIRCRQIVTFAQLHQAYPRFLLSFAQ